MLELLALLVGQAVFGAPPVERVVSPLLLRPPRVAEHLRAPVQRVSIKLDRAPEPELLARLEAAGARPVVLPVGGLALIGHVLSADVPRTALARVAAVPGVVQIAPARPLVRIKPLDRTASRSGAPQGWSPPRNTLGSMGEGVVIADHEGGWDIFHPDFFFPDGGVVVARDANRDGKIGPGDQADLDGDGRFEVELSLLEGVRDDAYTGEFGFTERGYQPDVDWLYADLNGNGRRDFGPGYGAEPGFGEPILVGDDVNRDREISGGERLVRLGTSKIFAVYSNGALYHRSRNLWDYPVQNIDPSHGTGAIGIAAAGWPELRRYTGMAPAAELLLIDSEDPVEGLATAQRLGANVNFFEWNSPIDVGDGSSAFEEAISAPAMQSSSQIAAAGNLANADHCMAVRGVGTATRTVSFTTDGQGVFSYGAMFMSLSWIGRSDELSIAISIGRGASVTIPRDGTPQRLGGFLFESYREDTTRGTGRVLIIATSDAGVLPEAGLTLWLSARRQIPVVRGLLFDDQSGWGRGIAWLTDQTDEGSALMPSTADRVIAVGAYGGNHDLSMFGWGGLDERRAYSGIGPRLDGAPVVDLTAPDDPFVAASDDGTHGKYGAFGGTSGALPHVAGAAALIGGSDRGYFHDHIEQRLREGAFADAFTGMVPNALYGHGKLSVARALHGRERIGRAPELRLSLVEQPAPGRQAIRAQIADEGPEVDVRLEWDANYDRIYELADERIERWLELPISSEPQVVVARATDPEGFSTRALLFVPPGAPLEPDAGVADSGAPVPDAGDGGGGGRFDGNDVGDATARPISSDAGVRRLPEVTEESCGCAASERGRSSSNVVLGLLLAALITSRVRRRRRSCGR